MQQWHRYRCLRQPPDFTMKVFKAFPSPPFAFPFPLFLHHRISPLLHQNPRHCLPCRTGRMHNIFIYYQSHSHIHPPNPPLHLYSAVAEEHQPVFKLPSRLAVDVTLWVHMSPAKDPHAVGRIPESRIYTAAWMLAHAPHVNLSSTRVNYPVNFAAAEGIAFKISTGEGILIEARAS